MTTNALKTDLPPLLDAMRERCLLSDGAMATMIYQKGVYINQSFENLNLERPHLVKNVHLEYIQAGSEILETNTFSANPFKLAKYGLADKVREINLAGVRLAREAASGKAWIAGVVGPPGQEREAAFTPGDVAELEAGYARQIEALAEGGVDALFLEAFSRLEVLEAAARVARKHCPDTPIAALVNLGGDGRTPHGDGMERIAEVFNSLPAEIVGFSDGSGPAILNKALEQLQPRTEKLLALLPGAGLPVSHEDRLLNMATPEYFMELLRRGMQNGARLIGGSSGCHPEHIKAIKGSLRMLQPASAAAAATSPAVEVARDEQKEITPPRCATPSYLQEKLEQGEFVVSIEIDPPIGTDATKALEAAKVCRDAGIDAINIADGPRATARMGPIDMAMLLRQEVRYMEPIVHFCCRDRNILGMQADLIGANALGIHNILMITGDPPKLGDYPFASAVYDVDAIGALKIGANLNAGMDLAGNPLRGEPTKLFLGAGANPGAIDLDHEIRRLERKVEAGASYILTQPVYDLALFERFHSRIGHLKVPILLGILPLASYRNAEFLTKEVPGMHVPSAIRERLRQCEDKESARQCGIDVARQALEQALPHIQGTYIMPPFNRVDSALAVLEVARPRMTDSFFDVRRKRFVDGPEEIRQFWGVIETPENKLKREERERQRGTKGA